jgi:hypothetical protein
VINPFPHPEIFMKGVEGVYVKGVRMTGAALDYCLDLVGKEKPLPSFEALRIIAIKERQREAREKAWAALRVASV